MSSIETNKNITVRPRGDEKLNQQAERLGLNNANLLEMYRGMCLIRRFERMADLIFFLQLRLWWDCRSRRPFTANDGISQDLVKLEVQRNFAISIELSKFVSKPYLFHKNYWIPCVFTFCLSFPKCLSPRRRGTGIHFPSCHSVETGIHSGWEDGYLP